MYKFTSSQGAVVGEVPNGGESDAIGAIEVGFSLVMCAQNDHS